MQKRATIKELYSEIRKYLFYMIPEKWNKIYLYASIIQRENGEETGEMFFYYFPQSILKRNPVNVYQVPAKFNLDAEEYIKLTDELYDLLKQLRHECIRCDKINWSNITISIENVEFLAEYNCEDLITSFYSNEDRMAIWQYKYLNYPIERFKKEQRYRIFEYLQEEERGLHPVIQYVETFYQQHEHNNIQYDISRHSEDKFIKVDENSKDFIMVDDNQYQIQSNKFFKRRKAKNVYENTTKPDEFEVRNQILKM